MLHNLHVAAGDEKSRAKRCLAFPRFVTHCGDTTGSFTIDKSRILEHSIWQESCLNRFVFEQYGVGVNEEK